MAYQSQYVNRAIPDDRVARSSREGASCVHTAFNLRETIATSMEASRHCFVAFIDVAKAFDTVWIDGLFKQMYDLGITGKTWRLLYRCYVKFKCCVKLQGSFSEWYEPQCPIHQGFFCHLSNMQYLSILYLLILRDLVYAASCIVRQVHLWATLTTLLPVV